MKKSIFIPSFVILSLLCVPIYFYYFAFATLAPSWTQLTEMLIFQRAGHWDLQLDMIFALHLLLYVGIFYFCAWATFQLGERISAFRLTFQVLVLSVVFCMSFLKVNYGAGLVDKTDTQTAWEVLQHCLNMEDKEGLE